METTKRKNKLIAVTVTVVMMVVAICVSAWILGGFTQSALALDKAVEDTEPDMTFSDNQYELRFESSCWQGGWFQGWGAGTIQVCTEKTLKKALNEWKKHWDIDVDPLDYIESIKIEGYCQIGSNLIHDWNKLKEITITSPSSHCVYFQVDEQTGLGNNIYNCKNLTNLNLERPYFCRDCIHDCNNLGEILLDQRSAYWESWDESDHYANIHNVKNGCHAYLDGGAQFNYDLYYQHNNYRWLCKEPEIKETNEDLNPKVSLTESSHVLSFEASRSQGFLSGFLASQQYCSQRTLEIAVDTWKKKWKFDVDPKDYITTIIIKGYLQIDENLIHDWNELTGLSIYKVGSENGVYFLCNSRHLGNNIYNCPKLQKLYLENPYFCRDSVHDCPELSSIEIKGPWDNWDNSDKLANIHDVKVNCCCDAGAKVGSKKNIYYKPQQHKWA